MARRITLILLASLACVSLLLLLGGLLWIRWRIASFYDDQGCQSAQSGAAIAADVLEKAIADGILDVETIFDQDYQPVPASSPQRFHTDYDRYLSLNLRPLQETFLNAHAIYHAYAVRTDGYIPVHTDPELDGVRRPELALDPHRAWPTSSERHVTKTGANLTFWDYDAPIVVLGRLWGYFRVGIPEGLVNQEMRRRGIAMGVVLLGISLVLAGLTFGVVRRNMRPLADVLAATTQLAMGDLAIRCPPGGRDEIAEVADSFNAMAEALQARDQRVTRAHRAIEEARSELEERVASRTGALEHTNGELLRALTSLRETQAELLHSQKLASVGQLAAGIAHEINTPTQFIADNVEFLRTGVRDLLTLLTAYRSIIVQSAGSTTAPGVLAQLEETEKDLDLAFLRSEVPGAIDQALEGTGRIAEIVKAMKQFAHPEQGELTHTDLNECIRSTVTVARSEWKYVAELELDLDPTLPLVPCLPGEFNQVMLNLVVNAAQAIGDAGGTKSGHKGHIRINSHVRDDQVEISVDDTGTGIPAEIQGRIFEPFFTTKEVGRGTGQGLAIAHSVIVHKLRGSLTFKTEVGRGTTFLIRLPLTGLVEAGEPPAAVA